MNAASGPGPAALSDTWTATPRGSPWKLAVPRACPPFGTSHRVTVSGSTGMAAAASVSVAPSTNAAIATHEIRDITGGPSPGLGFPSGNRAPAEQKSAADERNAIEPAHPKGGALFCTNTIKL